MDDELFKPADFMTIGVSYKVFHQDNNSPLTVINFELLAEDIAKKANKIFEVMHKCQPKKKKNG